MKSFQETPMSYNDEEPEESSWTFYFEEFLWQNDQKMIMSCNETLNSLAPDATSSSMIKKAACFQDDHTKKLRLKKRKNKGVIIDDSLEDTASSPLSGAKVCLHAFLFEHIGSLRKPFIVEVTNGPWYWCI